MRAGSRVIVVVALLLAPHCVANASSDLDAILQEWWAAASRVKRLDCDFVLYQYDSTFEMETRGTGSLAVDAGRAFYKIAPVEIPAGTVSRRVSKDGERFTLRSASAVRWHWTGESVIKIDDANRTFEEIKLAFASANVEFCPESPELPKDDPILDASIEEPSRRAKPTSNSEAVNRSKATSSNTKIAKQPRYQDSGWEAFFRRFEEALQESIVPRTFLLGMPVDEMRDRFDVKLLRQTDAEIWLRFAPKTYKEQAQLNYAILILSKEKYEPRALTTVDATNCERVYMFTNVQINLGWRSFFLTRDPLKRPNLSRYRSVFAGASDSDKK